MSKQTLTHASDTTAIQHLGEIIGRLQITVQQLESPPQVIQVRRA